MPLIETLPVDACTAQWPVWGTTARLVVTEPDRLPEARRLVEEPPRRPAGYGTRRRAARSRRDRKGLRGRGLRAPGRAAVRHRGTRQPRRRPRDRRPGSRWRLAGTGAGRAGRTGVHDRAA